MHLRVIVPFLAVLFLAGCATTPDGRIARAQEEFAALPAAAQEQIRAGRIDLGFTERMVWLALGEPARRIERVSAEGAVLVWVYERSAPRLGFSFGVGTYGRHSSVGTSVGMSTGGYRAEEIMRVEFVGGRVTRVENRRG